MAAEETADPENLFRVPGAKMVRDKRNLTARIVFEDSSIWIKGFRPKNAMDRFVYAMKQGKAVRAWNAAMVLLEKGFCTPKPLIGLQRTTRAGGVDGIVAFEDLSEHRALQSLLAADSVDAGTRTTVMADLGNCLRYFHDSGFRHRDLRRGNILAARTNGGWNFCFLDLNRLRVQQPLTEIQRLREVEKLNLPSWGLEPFFRAYMPRRNSAEMAATYTERVDYADRLEHLPLGKLIRKSWYYWWELRAIGFARRP